MTRYAPELHLDYRSRLLEPYLTEMHRQREKLRLQVLDLDEHWRRQHNLRCRGDSSRRQHTHLGGDALLVEQSTAKRTTGEQDASV